MSGSPSVNSKRTDVLRWCRWSDACREAAHFLESEGWERPDLPHRLRELADQLDQRLQRGLYTFEFEAPLEVPA